MVGLLPPLRSPTLPTEACTGSLAGVMHVACDWAGIVISLESLFFP